MKKLLVILIVCLVQNTKAQESDVKKTIQIFFEGMHQGDTLKIKSVCKGLVLQSISENTKGNTLTTENTEDFLKSIAALPVNIKIEERLLDYKIQIDGSLAHVWTPYEFYVNGKLSHSGVNSFQLFKDNGIWKIIYIADTRRK
ncbi:nuclear transport factor 2 family protein [Flavobacterium cerinum]|uniref:Nuclear transport factor 2 family protein n=1 Tax=Flavobacterium cerinum TaxID=2502784 RepID=A0A444HAW6_9FLAO|nr:nuclear transport factor 2 family protein [Flavobacterium cerinum]RWX00460.1 nuclear transport factor 2 family protein [Flavobacterium cerinum]